MTDSFPALTGFDSWVLKCKIYNVLPMNLFSLNFENLSFMECPHSTKKQVVKIVQNCSFMIGLDYSLTDHKVFDKLLPDHQTQPGKKLLWTT